MNENAQYIFASVIILLAINQFLLGRKLKRISSELKEGRVLTNQKLLTGLRLSKAAYNKCKELEFMLEDDSTPEFDERRDFDSEGTSEDTTSA